MRNYVSGSAAPGERVAVLTPDITFQRLDGMQAAAHAELLVRASWRRQGIGGALHDLILANRAEERATLTVLPAATPAQSAFQRWGWRKVARTHGGRSGWPVSDVLVTTLPRRSGSSL
jgi:GNAT superfamily N-acetyltransferase